MATASRKRRPAISVVQWITLLVVVKVDGVVVEHETDPLSGIVTLAEAPAEGAMVTASFEFDVPVRFDVDRLDIELSSFDAAEVPSIPLIEVRE